MRFDDINELLDAIQAQQARRAREVRLTRLRRSDRNLPRIPELPPLCYVRHAWRSTLAIESPSPHLDLYWLLPITRWCARCGQWEIDLAG